MTFRALPSAGCQPDGVFVSTLTRQDVMSLDRKLNCRVAVEPEVADCETSVSELNFTSDSLFSFSLLESLGSRFWLSLLAGSVLAG